MEKPTSKLFNDALQILDAYYRSVVTKVAEEIVESRDDFDSTYAGRGEEIVDRYGPHLQSLARIHGDLLTMASMLGQQESGSARSGPGMPITPSGVPIEPDAVLEPGAAVLVQWQGLWFRANVLSSNPDGTARIHYAGWGDNWDENVPRSRIQKEISDSTDTERPKD